MSFLKDETIHKIFGAHLRGGLGLALALLDRASAINWEALWPQFQNALIGLGAGAIAYLNRQAIAKGLTDLAQRIAAFQPIATPMPGEPLTWAEAMPIPYVPVPSIPETREWIKEHPPEAILKMKKYIDWADSVAREIDANITSFPPGDPNRCKVLENAYHTIQGILGILHYDSLTEYDEWQRSVDYWENKRKEIEEESRRSGCDYQRFEASPFGKGYLQW